MLTHAAVQFCSDYCINMADFSILRATLAVLCLARLSHGHKSYQLNIPNGANVPHPCKSNYIWQGVGHRSVLGGGERNPFGADFATAGGVWTQDFCNADSDQDGRTNGQELGDPSCNWTKAGGGTLNLTGLSHPGVCEPTDSADCRSQNDWVIDCSHGADFNCAGLSGADTVNMTFQLDRTLVPAQETTYACQSFTFPTDKVYHLFGSKPIIDNADMIYHMILYGCEDDADVYDTPRTCYMGGDKCDVALTGWIIGMNGECLGNNVGVQVGKGHFTKVRLAVHWNNPSSATYQIDASGLNVFLTPTLRTHNLSYVFTGQEALKIPGGQSQFKVEGTCPGSCTRSRFKDTVYVTSAHVHMHDLGRSGKLEHWREGQLIDTWYDRSPYSLQHPFPNEFSPAKEFRPGDDIKTVCTYDSSSRSTTTEFGTTKNDEMCYGYITYYPAENGPTGCVSYEEDDACTLYPDFSMASSSHQTSFLALSAFILASIYL